MANKSRIFISFSKDFGFALKLKNALEEHGFDIWIYLEDIPPTVDWLEEIYDGIKSSDIFLFLLSPDSIISETCNKEIDFASNRKRIIPILVREVDWKDVSEKISRFQAISFQEKDNFDLAFKTLLEAINTDFAWVKFHKKLDGKADDWEHHKDGSRLLRGEELRDAEQKLADAEQILANVGSQKDPMPTEPQKKFILASRKNANTIVRTITSLAIGTGIILVIACVTALVYAVIAAQRGATANAAQATAIAETNARTTAQANAESEQARAEEQKNIAHAGQLADQAESIRGQSPIVSFLLSIEAFNLFDNFQTRNTLMNNKTAYPQILRFISNPNVSKSNRSGISAIAVSGDGKIIAFAIDDTIILQDTVSGQQLRTLVLPPRNANGDRNYVHSLTFNPDSKILVSGGHSEGKIILWDIDSGLISRELAGGSQLAFSSDGQMLAASGDGTIIIWKISTNEKLCSINSYSNEGLSFIPQTNKFVTNVYVSISPDNQFESDVENNILIWDASTCKSNVFTFDLQVGRIYRTTISSDGQIFALETIANDVILWNISTNQPIITLAGKDYPDVNLIALSPDGNTFVIGYEDGDIILRDMKTGKTLKTFNRSSGRISNLLFNPDGNTLLSIGGNDEFAILWNLVQKQSVNILTGLTYQVSSVAFNSDGSILAAGNNGTSIVLWDPSTGKQICELEKHTKKIIDVAFKSDGTLMSTDISHEETLAWNPHTCQQIPNDNGLKFPYDPNYHGFSPDGQISADVKDQYTIILVDTGTSQPIGEPLIYNASSIFDIRFSPDGKILAAGCDDGTIVLWDVATSKMLGRFTGHNGTVYSLAFSPNGKILASGSADGTVRLWEVDPQTWLQEVCQTAGRNLTKDEWNRYFPGEEYRITCPMWLAGE